MDQEILLEVQDVNNASPFGKDSTRNELALVSIKPSRSSVPIAGGPTMSNGHSTGYSSNLYQGNAVSSSFSDIDDGYDVYKSTKGELLRKLWSSRQTTIAPRVFKGKLARFAPQFSGYNQHDSQVSIVY
ncbi:ubiquitin carboxyl-terminal hydrolase 9-like [Humulus lupulus]|uniref:ubiquitin carboxyl-terminal hydrolase 9-like n=1 Tax=Humulus lupulus TaxID=3486 RepID=UPI002B40C213|nr:ubiquitin carboxyl-terminal hydrolase 9-like [Humulus lupulus]